MGLSTSPSSARSGPNKARYATAQFLMGGFCGVASKTCTAPYERARLLLQLGAKGNTFQVMSSIYLNDGVLGYFRGNLVNCARQFMNKGLLFGFNDVFKSASKFLVERFKERGHTYLSWVPIFVSGSLAGLSMQLITYPVDVVRVRMAAQVGKTQFTGFFNTVRATISKEGTAGFYRGVTPTLWGALVYEGVKFGIFDVYLDYLKPYCTGSGVSPVPVAGALAGLTAVVLTHPNDTVRHRMQVQGLGGVAKLYNSTRHAYVTLFRTEGLRGFFRGLGTSVFGKVPSIAIQFTIYEGIKKGLFPFK